MLRRRTLLAATAAGTLSPSLGRAQAAPDLSGQPSLGALARSQGLTFGAAVQGQLLETDPDYHRAFETEAAILVPEWEAKWSALQPQEGRFDTAPLDSILRWAQSRARPVRGHALIWHNDLPDWTRAALGEGRDRALAVMAAHFDRVLSHARGQIRDWDVVNEPVANPPGSDVPQAGPGELRDTPWLRALGPNYIDIAFRMARERDPTLRLTLNEYGIEEDTPDATEKRRRLLALLRSLLARGTPLDAVGIQAHLQMVRPFRPAPFAAFLAELRQMGLAVLITELDVREAPSPPQDMGARDALVAERAHAFVATALEGGVRTILTWGLSDKYSWLATEPAVALRDGRTHRGLPLDAEWRRKALWEALARAFQGR
ncbi:endo-1,4-beta-xylanase [Teichococcus aestuarii]|uniref:Beta-xylanase n=2 Tax=Teichococcus aestuarii TaxID=568898 RepID=A0A2U1V7I0_9PROT|nr:endo-1,4-beta-xylanase [Pseudoroseomonas aestuarii]PWC29844.1 glycosyl hydrolase family 10 [Pseudoroseomonas aestuarii]